MTGRGPVGAVARWGLTGAAVLAAHLAAGIWLIQTAQRSEALQPPPPVFVDLAPSPEPLAPAAAPGAEAAPQTASPPQSDPAPEEVAESAPQQAAPDFIPPDMTELPPVEDFADLVPPPAPVPDFEAPPMTELPPVTDFAELLPDSALVLSASERPVQRPVRRAPEPEPQPQVTRRETPRQAQPQQQRQAEQQRQPQPARAQPQPQRQQQAAGGGGGNSRQQSGGQTGASRQQMANWSSQVGSRITRHMSRTRIGGARGGRVQIQVSVTISANGAASARLASSTGNARADSALARQAARLPRMPAPPNGQSASFTQPMVITLR
ncbi:protein TonB [Paracoccus isoporae]|uniref:Protein TonB n=1 Tax=Paracoccus isoporae TaxID=591205 RepID=A0A1G7GHI7_9RHOB|nr:TonB C-terminal domain-containing protein [Paracoccus isoporae]SDE87561.1 protein TonB [Paracoccus isoporae]